MIEIIYFEFNNWCPGRDYPEVEPFLSWMQNNSGIRFRDEEWIKENKLVVVESTVDMSMDFCVSATKEWVLMNCPELLTKYANFLRFGEEDGELPLSQFGCPFLEYNEDNIGYHYTEEKEDSYGYLYYSLVE